MMKMLALLWLTGACTDAKPDVVPGMPGDPDRDGGLYDRIRMQPCSIDYATSVTLTMPEHMVMTSLHDAFSYDAEGRATQDVESDEGGAFVTTTYTWDNSGHLLESVDTWTDGQVASSMYTYDSLGRMLQLVSDSVSGTSESIYTVTWSDFEEHGNPTRSVQTSLKLPENTTTGTNRTMEYDALGRMVVFEKTLPDATLLERHDYAYDDAARTVTTMEMFTDASPLGPLTTVTTDAYDDEMRLITTHSTADGGGDDDTTYSWDGHRMLGWSETESDSMFAKDYLSTATYHYGCPSARARPGTSEAVRAAQPHQRLDLRRARHEIERLDHVGRVPVAAERD